LEKRLLVAAGLSLLVLLAWEWLVPKPPKPPAALSPTPVSAVTTTATTGSAASSQAPSAPALSAPAALPPPASAPAEETVRIGNDLFTATFSNRGGVLTSFVLAKYQDEKNRPLDLVRALPPEFPRPLGLDFGRDAAATKAVSNALFVVEKESDRVVDEDLPIIVRVHGIETVRVPSAQEEVVERKDGVRDLKNSALVGVPPDEVAPLPGGGELGSGEVRGITPKHGQTST